MWRRISRILRKKNHIKESFAEFVHDLVVHQCEKQNKIQLSEMEPKWVKFVPRFAFARLKVRVRCGDQDTWPVLSLDEVLPTVWCQDTCAQFYSKAMYTTLKDLETVALTKMAVYTSPSGLGTVEAIPKSSWTPFILSGDSKKHPGIIYTVNGVEEKFNMGNLSLQMLTIVEKICEPDPVIAWKTIEIASSMTPHALFYWARAESSNVALVIYPRDDSNGGFWLNDKVCLAEKCYWEARKHAVLKARVSTIEDAMNMLDRIPDDRLEVVTLSGHGSLHSLVWSKGADNFFSFLLDQLRLAGAALLQVYASTQEYAAEEIRIRSHSSHRCMPYAKFIVCGPDKAECGCSVS